MKTQDFILALDLIASLGARMTAVISAISNARAEGRSDLSAAELETFRTADNAARIALDEKIDAARRRDMAGS